MINPIIINDHQQAFGGFIFGLSKTTGYYQRADRRGAGPRKTHKLHRVVWEAAHGPIPPGTGWHIHHIDHDPGNNTLANLRLMTVAEHNRHHHRPITKPRVIPRAQRIPEARPCRTCGEQFFTIEIRAYYCSPKCNANARNRRHAMGAPIRAYRRKFPILHRQCVDCSQPFDTKSTRKIRCDACQYGEVKRQQRQTWSQNHPE